MEPGLPLAQVDDALYRRSPRPLGGRTEYGSVDAFITTSPQADHEQQEHDRRNRRGHSAKPPQRVRQEAWPTCGQQPYDADGGDGFKNRQGDLDRGKPEQHRAEGRRMRRYIGQRHGEHHGVRNVYAQAADATCESEAESPVCTESPQQSPTVVRGPSSPSVRRLTPRVVSPP